VNLADLLPKREAVTDAAPTRLPVVPEVRATFHDFKTDASRGTTMREMRVLHVAPFLPTIAVQVFATGRQQWSVRHARPGHPNGAAAGQPRRQSYDGSDAGEWNDTAIACTRCGDRAPLVFIPGKEAICAACSLRDETPTPYGPVLATVRSGPDLLGTVPSTDAEQLVAVGTSAAYLRTMGSGIIDPWAPLRQVAYALAHRPIPVCVTLAEDAGDDIRIYAGSGPREWLLWWDAGDVIRL